MFWARFVVDTLFLALCFYQRIRFYFVSPSLYGRDFDRPYNTHRVRRSSFQPLHFTEGTLMCQSDLSLFPPLAHSFASASIKPTKTYTSTH